MNLLSETQKGLIKKGLRLRFLIVLSLMLAGAFVINITILLPAYFLARVRLVEVSNILYALPSEDTKGGNSSTLSLPGEINSKLGVYESNIPKYFVVEVFSSVAGVLPEGIRINSISFSDGTSVQNKTKEMNISGVSLNRQALILFSENLKKTSFAKNVEVPVSNLAREKNLPFSIKITLTD
ncbi:MAG: PilN domain-containing protein [Patescibacteria group bacterium]